MNKIIDIAFVFDDKFCDLFKVATYSIAINTNSKLAIHVVDCGIAEENKEQLRKFLSTFKNISSVEFRFPQRIDILEKFPMKSHFSPAIFYRLAIPKIFPELSRVIYLDCDTITTGDISNLWNEDLQGRPFGAVEEDGNFSDEKTKLRKMKEINLPKDNHYYNSGALLIDTHKFESDKIFERVLEIIAKTNLKLSCPEQDAMNLCLADNEHMALPAIYNFMPFAPLAKQYLKNSGNVIIVHHASTKPWHMNKTIVKMFHFFGFYHYSTGVFLQYWEYADCVDKKKFSNGNIFPALKFFYKCFFQPFERYIIRRFCYLVKFQFIKLREKI
ncbi:MAG: glycosyltransferase family 8 protein [Puniceicoccales bacterium]|jgi:lipopolysaccharide biosynthesis glycosyltransferase|nr:glycosyltransferase family 8 protein [Puniceicoccales bacterium]